MVPSSLKAWLEEERPLHYLQYGRHVHQNGYNNWQDQAHLHKEIQEGAQGDEIANLLNHFLAQVGGRHQSPDSRFGLRFSGCYVGDLCWRNVRNFKKL